MRVHTLFYLLHDVMAKPMICTHRHYASLGLFTFWWCHNWLCNAGDDINDLAIVTHTWILICNLLDKDFIHSNIHCQENNFFFCIIFLIFHIVQTLVIHWSSHACFTGVTMIEHIGSHGIVRLLFFCTILLKKSIIQMHIGFHRNVRLFLFFLYHIVKKNHGIK